MPTPIPSSIPQSSGVIGSACAIGAPIIDMHTPTTFAAIPHLPMTTMVAETDRDAYLACMSDSVTVIVIVIGVVALAVLIVGVIAIAFRRHNPARAAASVAVAAGVPFQLQLTGSPGKLFFRFQINENVGTRAVGKMGTIVDRDKDLLVSGEIVDDDGGTRAFAVKTSERSTLEGARSARRAHTEVAASDSSGSILLAALRTGDRVARGVVLEHPKEKLLKAWVYVPRRW